MSLTDILDSVTCDAVIDRRCFEQKACTSSSRWQQTQTLTTSSFYYPLKTYISTFKRSEVMLSVI